MGFGEFYHTTSTSIIGNAKTKAPKFSGLSKHQISSHQIEKAYLKKKGYQLTQPPCWIGPQFKSYQNIIQTYSPSHGFLVQIADLTMGTDGTSLCAYAQWGGNFVVFRDLLEVDLDGPMLLA